MNKSRLLLLDALINFVLGVLLVTSPRSVVDFLGVPHTDVAFYPTVLGGVLLGIAVALWVVWLLSGRLAIPLSWSGVPLGSGHRADRDQPCGTGGDAKAVTRK